MKLIRCGINRIKRINILNKKKNLIKKKDIFSITENHLSTNDYNHDNFNTQIFSYISEEYPLTSINNNYNYSNNSAFLQLQTNNTDNSLHDKGNCMCFIILLFFYLVSTILTNIRKQFIQDKFYLNTTNVDNKTLTENNNIKNNNIENKF